MRDLWAGLLVGGLDCRVVFWLYFVVCCGVGIICLSSVWCVVWGWFSGCVTVV